MKRSEVNTIILQAKAFFGKQNFNLPEWAYWAPAKWAEKKDICSGITENNLGWDITDFGTDNFQQKGLVLFTIRNGNLEKKGNTYCEKIMIADENQETPLHFHWKKTEDIINRGGGNLVLELFLATTDGDLTNKPVEAIIDGIIYKVDPGEPLILKPGQSIRLEPYMYHRFYGQKASGKVLIGEVSTVNDDENDNHFYEGIGRFPSIIEDEEPLYLLSSDYGKYC